MNMSAVTLVVAGERVGEDQLGEQCDGSPRRSENAPPTAAAVNAGDELPTRSSAYSLKDDVRFD
jgi:hypothetical protein